MTTYSYAGPSRYEMLRGELSTHVAAAKAIVERAEREGRATTAAEEAEGLAILEKARQVKTEMGRAKTDEQCRAAIRDFGNTLGGADSPAAGDPRVKALGGSGWGEAFVRHHRDGMGNVKSLLPAGAVPVTVPLATEPVRTGEPVLSLRQVLPTAPDTVGRWSYFRQTLRENNAAVVAPGARKPTSRFSLERAEARAVTIAHLSEPMNRADLDDADMLREFVDIELRLGLEAALEEEIVSGDGTGEHFLGLATTSGTQTQSWTGDLLATTRAALTKLEALSLVGSAYLLSPADWERAELSVNASGYALDQGGAQVPVNRAARRLWSAPVLVSTSVPVGIGYLIDAGSVELRIREEARIDWSEHIYSPDQFGTGQGGSLFEANQIQFRCEMRAGWAIKRPAGVVELDLTAG